MLYTHFTEKLIGLQDIIVKKVFDNAKTKSILIEMQKKPHVRPRCGTKTSIVHDYRKQIIKDIPAFGKHLVLILNKRRYACKDCRKRFFEENKRLPRYHRITNRLAYYIIERLSEVSSFAECAKTMQNWSTGILNSFIFIKHTKAKASAYLFRQIQLNHCTHPRIVSILIILPTFFISSFSILTQVASCCGQYHQ